MHRARDVSKPTGPSRDRVSAVIGHDGPPTSRDGSDSQFPNVAIPRKRLGVPMASKLDQSNSRVNRGWIDGGGNRVREPREITTDFLYHAPLSSCYAIDKSAHLYATTSTAPAGRQSHTETKSTKNRRIKGKPVRQTTNYRISEGQKRD